MPLTTQQCYFILFYHGGMKTCQWKWFYKYVDGQGHKNSKIFMIHTTLPLPCLLTLSTSKGSPWRPTCTGTWSVVDYYTEIVLIVILVITIYGMNIKRIIARDELNNLNDAFCCNRSILRLGFCTKPHPWARRPIFWISSGVFGPQGCEHVKSFWPTVQPRFNVFGELTVHVWGLGWTECDGTSCRVHAFSCILRFVAWEPSGVVPK